MLIMASLEPGAYIYWFLHCTVHHRPPSLACLAASTPDHTIIWLLRRMSCKPEPTVALQPPQPSVQRWTRSWTLPSQSKLTTWMSMLPYSSRSSSSGRMSLAMWHPTTWYPWSRLSSPAGCVSLRSCMHASVTRCEGAPWISGPGQQ